VRAALGAYGAVLGDPAARAFSLAGLVARLPLSMTGIGIVLLVSLTTGSFALAGVITAVATLTGGLAAPLWGRAIDRTGQAPVLVAASLVWTVGLSLLLVAVLRSWPVPAALGAAVLVGVGFSLAGSAVRARWNHHLQGSPLLETAFAVEAVLDEVIFIIGPVLVTFLATAVHPAAALAVSAVTGLVGALALAAQRGTEPPLPERGRAARERGRIDPWALVPVVAVSVALGAVFGGMEVVVVAFAAETGVLPYAGAILMAWAVGSLLAGVVTGTVAWRRTPATRFRVGAACLAVSLLPLPWVREPLLVAALLLVSGMAIAPTLIASVAVTRAVVPQSRLTEALAWSSTGVAGGLAAGAAGLGFLIDRGGSRLGFWGVVAAGVLLILGSLWVRTKPEVEEGAATGVRPAPPGTPAADPPPGSARSR
jgi:MFS family permease